MHGKMISNDRSEHLPRPPWRYSLQRRWQAPRASRSRPQRRRSRPGKIVGVRFRVRTNFDHGLHSATACGTSPRSSPKAARPSTRSTCGSMIAVTDVGPVNPTLTSSRSGCTVDAAPGGEPTSSILSRARPALDAWAEQAQACDHTLIVVTHDAVIRPLQINIARQPSLCATWPPASTNCCDAIRRLGASNGQTSFPDTTGTWPSSSCAASLLKASLR